MERLIVLNTLKISDNTLENGIQDMQNELNGVRTRIKSSVSPHDIQSRFMGRQYEFLVYVPNEDFLFFENMEGRAQLQKDGFYLDHKNSIHAFIADVTMTKIINNPKNQ